MLTTAMNPQKYVQDSTLARKSWAEGPVEVAGDPSSASRRRRRMHRARLVSSQYTPLMMRNRFITAQPMKHDAYPLDPGKKGSLVNCHICRPKATRPPRTAVHPATSQSKTDP